MLSKAIHLLLVDDCECDADLIRDALDAASDHYDLTHAVSLSNAAAHLRSARIDAVLLDLGLAESSGLDTLRRFQHIAGDIPVVVITDHNDLSVSQVIEAGGHDILAREHVQSETIARCVRHAIERQHSADTIRRADELLERRAAELEHFNQQLQTEISERRRIEQGMEAARIEAEAANHAKTEFLACMSHELRTPLNAIIGFSDGLLGRIDTHPLTEHQIDRIKKILASGHHLLTLINDILDIAKIEAGEMKTVISRFTIASLIGEVSDMVEALGKDNQHVKFVRAVPPQAIELTSDRRMLKQILINLIGNAFKFTAKGTITLRVLTDGEAVCFTVQDTGVGIASGRLHTIFDKFSQLDASTTREKGGTGLGLAICHSFAELLHGQLSVRSEVEKGSCFKLTIPLTPPTDVDVPVATTPNAAMPCTGPDTIELPTVLCIDDSPVSQRMMRHFLVDGGYGFLPAFCGEDGLRLARTMAPTVVTLDVMMPDVDGWKVLRELKQDPVTRNIPVLLITSLESTDPMLSRGAAECLAKPIRKEPLLAKLRQLVERKECAA